MKKLFQQLLLLTVVIILLVISLKYGLRASFVHDTVWYILAFIVTLTAFSLWLGLLGGSKSPELVVPFVLGGTVLRLILSAIGIYVALRLGVPDRLAFVLNFMAVYFVYLTFEIYGLLSHWRDQA